MIGCWVILLKFQDLYPTSFFFPPQTVKALNHLKENLKIIHRGGYGLLSVELESTFSPYIG